MLDRRPAQLGVSVDSVPVLIVRRPLAQRVLMMPMLIMVLLILSIPLFIIATGPQEQRISWYFLFPLFLALLGIGVRYPRERVEIHPTGYVRYGTLRRVSVGVEHIQNVGVFPANNVVSVELRNGGCIPWEIGTAIVTKKTRSYAEQLLSDFRHAWGDAVTFEPARKIMYYGFKEVSSVTWLKPTIAEYFTVGPLVILYALPLFFR